MNARQRVVLWGAFGAVAVAFLFPPFSQDFGRGVRSLAGWGFLFIGVRNTSGVHIPLLATEFAVILLLAGIAYFALRD